MFAFWILFGIVPSALTRNGGMHAIRLVVILPAFILLMSYGFTFVLRNFKKYGGIFAFIYIISWVASFGYYQHKYWIHYPWDSERWWSFGYRQVYQVTRDIEDNYKKIIIEGDSEKPEIFFAAYYPADPSEWQRGLKDSEIEGPGQVKEFEKYYFVENGDEAKEFNLPEGYLYVSPARKYRGDLTVNQKNVPKNYKLIDFVKYPSGEPIYYFFAKK